MSCIQLYYACLHWHNRTDGALPMSCYVSQWRKTRSTFVYMTLLMPRLSSVCQWRHTHSTFVYRKLLMPRLSCVCQWRNNVRYTNVICVYLHWHNMTDEALPMSYIQMYYVCVFIDIIAQYICRFDIGSAPSVLLCQWRHKYSTFLYMTLVVPRLSYCVNEDKHSTIVYRT
jgi:hypothetical protein